MPAFVVLPGDCVDVMRSTLDADSVDAIVTDPPYGLEFMGKGWDHGVPGVEFWIEALRVAKPGAHLLAFGGTRTFHRLACAIEDAGWELRDTIMWVYGSGFPKSLDVSKAIDKAAGAEREVVGRGNGGMVRRNQRNAELGYRPSAYAAAHTNDVTAPATDDARRWEGWGTALKPAYEPIIVARKPLVGTVARNVLAYGTGALNIDGCRVPTDDSVTNHARSAEAAKSKGKYGDSAEQETHQTLGQALGRWPANLIHDGSDEVVALFPDTGVSSGGRIGKKAKSGVNIVPAGEYTAGDPGYGDSGSAARFFKTCEFDAGALIIRRAKAIIQAWNPSLANTVDENSSLPSRVVDSALNDAATWAGFGVTLSSEWTGPTTRVTPNESRRLVEVAMMTILSIGDGCSFAWLRGRRFQPDSHVSVVATSGPTGTTTITISHWKSDGSADPVTFSITPNNTAPGDLVCDSRRLIYCAKASKADREEGNNHPTVKPTALMRYLCRLVTQPGGLILDPFCGSGSTGKAALLEGFRFVGIEREAAYREIAEARLSRCTTERFCLDERFYPRLAGRIRVPSIDT